MDMSIIRAPAYQGAQIHKGSFHKFCFHMAAAAIVYGSCFTVAHASPVTFYSGKSINIIISSNAGGGYDTYGRLLARYLGKHIPGSPHIVVQDMPGAGGLRAAQAIYSVAPKDGATIGLLRGSNMLDAVLGIRGVGIDPNKFGWIGNMAGDTDVCSFWSKTGVRSWKDLKKKQFLVGGSAAGSQGFIFPHLINYVLHTKMKVVLGYKGVGDRILALERGELQGNCGINGSTLTGLYSQMIAKGQLIPVLQSGLRPYPALPKVPMTDSLVKDPKRRAIVRTVSSIMEISRIFAAPPGTPSKRIKLLRSAFSQTVRDPQLIADAKREKLNLSPSSGKEVAKVVRQMTELSSTDRKEARRALGE